MATETVNVTDLARVGKGISQDFTAVVAGSGFYGIYVVLFFVSLYSITRQDRWWRSGPPVALFTMIVIMFGLSTFLWSSNVHLLWKRIRMALLHFELGPLRTRLTLVNSKTAKLRYMTDIMFIIEYLLGDALLAWRVFVLHRWSPFVVGGLALIWLGTAAAGLGLLVCYVENDFNTTLPPRCKLYQNSSWTISLAFNLAATILLSIIAWNHRKTVNAAQRSRKTKVDRVLYILVASGAIYFILGCMRLSLYANSAINPLPGTVSHANIVLEFTFNQLVGIYPTLVTALVLNERTLFGSSLSSTYVASSGPAPSQSIHFKTRETQLSEVQMDAVSPTRLDATEEVPSLRRHSSSIHKTDVEKAS